MTSVTAEPVPFLSALVARRTWQAYGYLWLSLLLAPLALAYVVAVPSLAAGVAVTVVGLWLPAAMVLGARGWAAAYRSAARSLLGVEAADPPAFARPRGFWSALGAALGDPAGWRALLFMLATFPLSILGFVVSTTWLATAAGSMTHWFWSRWLPLEQAADGTWHRGAQLGPGQYVDTPARQALLALAGLLLLLAWPWVNRLCTSLQAALTRTLLGPTAGALRVASLRASRAATVEDADARLRRIERDLHDGTQARLVAVAMQLGEAREQLAAGADPALAAELVEVAHESTKDALGELREIARGIHPPALDAGLAVALETLAARAPLPVTVEVGADVEAAAPLAPAVQSIAYYCAAELLTNVAKHAGASRARVEVTREAGAVRLRVHDDGHGGAAVAPVDGTGRRTGLAGLGERVAAVDGVLDVRSPAGGPTVVTVTLPTTTRP
ncbi:sensor histidine kinase [Xylanimonas oleitrophica]|uniref:histidine kinase n=1 Tax=Xylanimonas oleitrophica TaxID=2607479 RepID=A0A2W5X0X4_9MICO|nr:sensor histidine kinase [Xylanimonas oleitrophica]PZR54376.1 sensor histidine kinase [Xylanimonas oleitrophica]